MARRPIDPKKQFQQLFPLGETKRVEEADIADWEVVISSVVDAQNATMKAPYIQLIQIASLHKRGTVSRSKPPSRKRRENRHRFPVPEEVQHFDNLFGSSPEHAHIQPEHLEILVNHLNCAAFEGKRYFHFPITNHLLFIT
jgi:hypothetical protein